MIEQGKGGTMSELCMRVKAARTKLHLSQQYVADYLGVGRSAVADIEAGRRKVSAEELGSLSELFLVPVEELLNGRSSAAPSQVFARRFDQLDEDDQREILNLMEFKRMVKARG